VSASVAITRPYARTNALGTLAIVDVRRGRLRSARRHTDDALAVAREHSLPPGRTWAKVHFADGLVAFHEGRHAHAERALQDAARMQEPGLRGAFEAWVLAELARVRLARGRPDGARGALAEAREILDACGDPGMVAGIARDVATAIAAGRRAPASSTELPSPAERAVLALLPTPLSTRQIAEELYLSINTVRTHVRVLYRKLGVHSREDAVDRAQALGLFDSPG
jgi:LuxR family maltose regulon positive regulatory protein